jgi:hypothetical protein
MTNFWQGLEEFNQQENETVEVEFRLYYNEHGYPLFYTTEKADGEYVIVDQETYARGDYQNIKVNNGYILQRSPTDSVKLVPHDTEGTCCNTNDITLIDDTKTGQYWKIKTHEYR